MKSDHKELEEQLLNEMTSHFEKIRTITSPVELDFSSFSWPLPIKYDDPQEGQTRQYFGCMLCGLGNSIEEATKNFREDLGRLAELADLQREEVFVRRSPTVTEDLDFETKITRYRVKARLAILGMIDGEEHPEFWVPDDWMKEV